MKSLKNRLRYKKGLTDYYHRYKMLKNYDSIVRIFLSKKNKYYLCGVYETPDLSKADVCRFYLESRWLKTQDTERSLKNNQQDLLFFGALVGSKINNLEIPKSKKLIVDLGRRKKLKITNFIKGLSSTLNSSFNFNFLEQSEELDSSIIDKIQFK